MATLNDLVKGVSAVTGLPEATVFSYGRFARQGGLIRQAGRGLNAASMTVADAANLLIAIGGTAVTREATETIQTFRALRNGTFYDLAGPILSPVLTWLSDYGITRTKTGLLKIPGTFGEFFEFLIRSSLNGDLAKLFFNIPVAEVPGELYKKWSAEDSLHLQEPLETLLKKGLIKPIAPSDLEFGRDMSVEITFNRLVPSVEIELQRLWDSVQTIGLITFGPERGGKAHGAHRLQIRSTFTQHSVAAAGLIVSDQVEPNFAARCTHVVDGLFWHQFQKLAGISMDAENVAWLAKLQTV